MIYEVLNDAGEVIDELDDESPRNCRGGPDTCGGCDRCLVLQAQHHGSDRLRPKQEKKGCPECNGATVEFRGHGGDTQYRVCSRYAEPGHLSAEEIRQRVSEQQQAIRPSGRWA